MAALIPQSSLYVISSPHGHDSFLIEIKQLNDVCSGWLQGKHVRGIVTKQQQATGGATTVGVGMVGAGAFVGAVAKL
jgi:hypothetical protein